MNYVSRQYQSGSVRARSIIRQMNQKSVSVIYMIAPFLYRACIFHWISTGMIDNLFLSLSSNAMALSILLNHLFSAECKLSSSHDGTSSKETSKRRFDLNRFCCCFFLVFISFFADSVCVKLNLNVLFAEFHLGFCFVAFHFSQFINAICNRSIL